jgi:hypothetical protein
MADAGITGRGPMRDQLILCNALAYAIHTNRTPASGTTGALQYGGYEGDARSPFSQLPGVRVLH